MYGKEKPGKSVPGTFLKVDDVTKHTSEIILPRGGEIRDTEFHNCHITIYCTDPEHVFIHNCTFHANDKYVIDVIKKSKSAKKKLRK